MDFNALVGRIYIVESSMEIYNPTGKSINCKGFEQRRLRDYRRIYLVYPQLGTEIAAYIQRNRLESPYRM